MNIKEIEKILNKYEEVNGFMFLVKNSKTHTIKIEGNNIDIAYLFTELVRSLNGKIHTNLLRFAFELGLEDKDND